MKRGQKTGVILGITALGILAILVQGPIPQDPDYHAFADRRTIYGIPNFWNVVSNVPMLIGGLAGLVFVRVKKYTGGLPALKLHYAVFFAGAMLVGVGSSWYHLHPDNNTLVWDRLPMTLAFMSLFSAIMGENISIRTGRMSLWPLLVAGVASVFYWQITEQAGHGDLRFYAVIQFLPLLLIPAIMLLLPSPFSANRPLVWMLFAYVLAKLAEFYDREIFAALDLLSGHSLKHLFAALGIYCYYLALKLRTPRIN